MSTTYIRRPFAMGNTSAPVLSQPVLRGSLMKDSTGSFAGSLVPLLVTSELVIETKSMVDAAIVGGISTQFDPSDVSMTTILSQLNAALAGYATAAELEGCLVITGVDSGADAYVRVMPSLAGFPNAAATFGFDAHPHPLATSTSGDLEDAPVRPRQQVNPIGTKFIATGEDRVGSAYNRALQMLGGNSDLLYTWLKRAVVRAVEIVVPSAVDGSPSPYVTVNVDGSIDQVDLTDLSVFDATLAGKRLYVGGMSSSSTLSEIAEFYEVLDVDRKQLVSGDRTVRIGAVTRGPRSGSPPEFDSETVGPDVPLGNTTSVPDTDGLNALGTNRAKHAGVTITEIRQRTTVVCAGAAFSTNGVQPGDLALVSGAAIDVPFNHDGWYIIETVVSNEELVLRPHEDTGHVRELNPATGMLGAVTVYSGGVWERDLAVSFYPPIARFPAGGSIILVIPVEEELGQVSLDDITQGSIRTNNDVAGWALLQLWRNQNLDGVYQGMASARGSGAHARITHSPFRLDLSRSAALSAGSVARPSTGASVLACDTLRLSAAPSDRFDIGDVGETILLNGGPLIADEPWTISKLIDNATVELAPPIFRAGYRGVEGSSVTIDSWEIIDGDALDVYGHMHAVSPEYFGEADTVSAAGGYFFTRVQRDTATPDAPTPGLFSFLHLEHIRLHRSGANITITTTSGALSVDTATVPLSFNPEDSANFFAETYATKTTLGQASITFLRVLNGPNAGLYRVKELTESSAVVQHLDGSDVLFVASDAVQVAFYNATVGCSVPILGGPGAASKQMAAQSLFVDGYEQGADFVAALRVGWRGAGAGIYAYINDPEFKAYDNGDGADGPVAQLTIFAPGEGLDVSMIASDTGEDGRRSGHVLRARAHTSRFDLSLSAPTGEGPRFDTEKAYGAYVSQTGKDPALVVVKQDADGADASTAYSKLSPSATFLVGRAGAVGSDDLSGTSGRGSAIEAAGSIYVYRHTDPGAEAPAWAEGGVFVEDVVGAGRWLYPTVGVYDFEASPQEGTGLFSGWTESTSLGNAGRVYPPKNSDMAANADVLPPDFAIFNFEHTALLHIANVGQNSPALSAPFNRFVGCRLRLTSGTYENDEFAIVGSVLVATNEVYFALHHKTTIVEAEALGSFFEILGQRWHRAYLNIADFALVGTEDATASAADLPLLAADNAILNARRTDVPTSALIPALGMQSYAPWSGAADGVSIGNAADLTSDMTSVHVLEGSYSKVWGGDFESLLFSHGWKTDTDEPRSPFPNSALFSSPEPDDDAATQLSSTDYAGNLAADDFAATFISGVTVITWGSAWGGCLVSTGAADAQVRIWQRGRTYALAAHLSVRVQLRAVVTGSATTRDVTIALRKANGDVLASADVSLVADGLPQDLVTDLVLSSLTELAVGGLGASKLGESLHVTVDITHVTGFEHVCILEFKTEPTTRPAVVEGPQVVLGTQLAHGYRFTDPVRGFQTIGPADVKLLGGLDYARNESWPTYDSGSDGWTGASATGTQELRCTPGLVRMCNDNTYFDWQTELTVLALAAEASFDAWTSTLKTAVDTDHVTALGDSVLTACPMHTVVSGALQDVLDEADPTQKEVLLQQALGLVSALITQISQVQVTVRNSYPDMWGELSTYGDEINAATAAAAPDVEEYLALQGAGPETTWVRPWVDGHRLFSQGVHSAAITLYNGAFDPLWYAKQANAADDGAPLRTSGFIPCGSTGFLVPLDPPHGSILTSLAVGLSFRAHTASRWGVYRDMVDSLKQLGRDPDAADSKTFQDVAHEDEWIALQGVNVELWRYNCVDFDVSEDNFASWDEHEPEHGFGERIAHWTVDLSEVTPPTSESNTVGDAWTIPALLMDDQKDVYVGKEHFEKRNWNLLQGGTANNRVDRRHYAYMLVVRFYGGMRYTSGVSQDEPFVRGDATNSPADSRWEIPQTITRKIGDASGLLAEGQIYGHFDAAYNVQDHNMNEPWGGSSFPPQVKFRGARLGWITDRAGDGGWGT